MSYLVEREIACSHCQFPNKVEVWSTLNVQTDPELKDLLLGGEINMAECESCHEIFYAEHFLLYHDPSQELLAFVYPHAYSSERARWEQKTVEDFAKTQEVAAPDDRLRYAPVSVFGLDELVRLVENEDEMAIQGEIVSLLAPDHDYRVKTLAPARARLQQLPPVIPYTGAEGHPTRAAVLTALAKVRAANDRLFVYEKLEDAIQRNGAWALTPE